jgi:hypothetical protein
MLGFQGGAYHHRRHGSVSEGAEVRSEVEWRYGEI